MCKYGLIWPILQYDHCLLSTLTVYYPLGLTEFIVYSDKFDGRKFPSSKNVEMGHLSDTGNNVEMGHFSSPVPPTPPVGGGAVRNRQLCLNVRNGRCHPFQCPYGRRHLPCGICGDTRHHTARHGEGPASVGGGGRPPLLGGQGGRR